MTLKIALGANLARLMARSGYDWVCVDTEHGNIDGEIYLYLPGCAIGTDEIDWVKILRCTRLLRQLRIVVLVLLSESPLWRLG